MMFDIDWEKEFGVDFNNDLQKLDEILSVIEEQSAMIHDLSDKLELYVAIIVKMLVNEKKLAAIFSAILLNHNVKLSGNEVAAILKTPGVCLECAGDTFVLPNGVLKCSKCGKTRQIDALNDNQERGA